MVLGVGGLRALGFRDFRAQSLGVGGLRALGFRDFRAQNFRGWGFKGFRV